MVDGSAAILPEHTTRMRIVDHHDAAEFFGERAQVGYRAKVAVHAEHAVGDEELALRGGQIHKDPPRGADVLVWEHFDSRATEPAAVDDAGVIELVGDDHILL